MNITKLTDEKLFDLLVNAKVLTKEQVVSAKEYMKKEGADVSSALIDNHFATSKQIAKVRADYYGWPFIDLTRAEIDEGVLEYIPELTSRNHEVVAFKEDKQFVHIGMTDPLDLPMQRMLEKKIEKPIQFYLATKKGIQSVLKLYHPDLGVELDKIVTGYISQLKSKGDSQEELPIIRITDIMIQYAINNNASDIHIEPGENSVSIRFRMDGILHDVIQLPKLIHEAIVARIKILSKLRTDDHVSAQDGRFSFKKVDIKTDVRVSILPVTEGEKVVMRLLSDKASRLTINDLGLSQEDKKKLKLAMAKPYGMILAAGPSGSGKTTTLYAVVQVLNKRTVNIATIEDPVEYDLEGINQTQVNRKTNLTFAKGLRSLVRQDPDIIMVGEIRDEETANISVNAAMTGHLVLSTLHANNAATSIPRLLDMGVQPFLLASSLNIIIAQRLVRRICRRCSIEKILKPADIKKVEAHIPLKKYLPEKVLKKFKVHHGKGCSACGNTGYAGRIGIYELLDTSDEIRSAIIGKKTADEITKIAIKQGMTTMLEDGLRKVQEGVTTIEEVMRVMSEA